MKDNAKKLTFAEQFRPLLQDLRWAAHNPNVIKAEPGAVMSSKMEGWEFGCKVEDMGTFCQRKVFVIPPQPWDTIPEADKDPVMNVVFDEMLETGTPATSIEHLDNNCLMIVQHFIPLLLEKTDRAKGHIKINDNLLTHTGVMH